MGSMYPGHASGDQGGDGACRSILKVQRARLVVSLGEALLSVISKGYQVWFAPYIASKQGAVSREIGSVRDACCHDRPQRWGFILVFLVCDEEGSGEILVEGRYEPRIRSR